MVGITPMDATGTRLAERTLDIGTAKTADFGRIQAAQTMVLGINPGFCSVGCHVVAKPAGTDTDLGREAGTANRKPLPDWRLTHS